MSALKNLSVTFGVFMAVFVLSIVSAQNEPELSSQSDLETLEEIQELLRNIQLLYELKIASKIQRGGVEEEIRDENDVRENPIGCSCSGLTCSCCKQIGFRRLRMRGECCLSVTYVPDRSVLEISLKFKSRPLFTQEIPASTSEPLCMKIPKLKFGCSACIEFYNTSIEAKSFSGCAKIRVRFLGMTILNVDLGCFRMGSSQQVEAIQLPYFDGQQAPVEGPEPLYLGEVLMKKIKPNYYKKN